MSGQREVFIGINPIAAHLTYDAVVLDENFHLLENRECSLEDVLPFCQEFDQAVAALCSARHPNLGLVNRNSAKRPSKVKPPVLKQDKRLCEAILNRHGIKTLSTPADPLACSPWVRQGFELFKKLEEGGFNSFSGLEGEKRLFETHAEGVFRALLAQPLLTQRSLEGRLQRQLILYEQGLRISDPMVFFEEVTRHRLIQGNLPLQTLLPLSKLDAMAAAFMAWYAAKHQQKVMRVGDEREGTILLPYWKELEMISLGAAQQMQIFS